MDISYITHARLGNTGSGSVTCQALWMRGRLIVISAFILMLLFEPSVAAPNLVNNPSFELRTSCPNNLSQIALATPWSGFGVQDTPDYYNLCATSGSGVGLPSNTFGNETARTGQAYSGFIARPSNPAREYLRTTLSFPLVAGVAYEVSFYVSLSDASQWAMDKIGAYLSVGPAPASNGYILGVTPQVLSPAGNYINNKNGWTLVSGTYIAAGGEDHLTIGNFANDSSTNLITGLGGWYPGSYYYVDDVAVEELENQQGCATVEAKPAVCNTAGSGYTYTFNVTNNSGKDVDQILLTPNPSGNMSLSQQIFKVTPFHHGDTTTLTVNIGDLKAGSKHCFFVTLMTKEGSCCSVQVCPSLPDCCATVTSEFKCGPKGSYTGTLTIVNTSPNQIQSIYLYPPGGVTMSQTYFAISLAPGQSFTTPPITIQGAKSGELCFRISLHTADMKECCVVEQCISLAECGFHPLVKRSQDDQVFATVDHIIEVDDPDANN